MGYLGLAAEPEGLEIQQLDRFIWRMLLAGDERAMPKDDGAMEVIKSHFRHSGLSFGEHASLETSGPLWKVVVLKGQPEIKAESETRLEAWTLAESEASKLGLLADR